MELTLTVQGSAEEIRRILAIIDHLGEGEAAGDISDRRLVHFVLASSSPMLAALNVVVTASARDETVTRSTLAEAAGLGSDAELNGVLGSIGRAWARRIGGENPFLGATGPDGAVFYRIDRELAERLLPLIERRMSGPSGHGPRGRRWGRAQ